MNTPAAYPAVQGQLPLPEQRWPMPADAPAGLAPAGPSLERKVTVPRDEPIPAGSTLPSRPVQLGAWDNVPTTADMDALPGEGGPAGGVLRVYCTSWNMANNVRRPLSISLPRAVCTARCSAWLNCFLRSCPRRLVSQPPPASLKELLTWVRGQHTRRHPHNTPAPPGTLARLNAGCPATTYHRTARGRPTHPGTATCTR